MIVARLWGTTPDVLRGVTRPEFDAMVRQLSAEREHARRAAAAEEG